MGRSRLRNGADGRRSFGRLNMREHAANPAVPRIRGVDRASPQPLDQLLPARRRKSGVDRGNRLRNPTEDKTPGENQGGTTATCKEGAHGKIKLS
jgi:hypothetical protein